MGASGETAAEQAKRRGLSLKQNLFVEEYLTDLNAMQAAIRSGYAKSQAGNTGYRLLCKPEIQAAVIEAYQERINRVQIDADYVLRQAVLLHERCMADIEIMVDNMGSPMIDADGRYICKFDSAGAARALEMVGKHIKVKAFGDKAPAGMPDDDELPGIENKDWTVRIVDARDADPKKAITAG